MNYILNQWQTSHEQSHYGMIYCLQSWNLTSSLNDPIFSGALRLQPAVVPSEGQGTQQSAERHVEVACDHNDCLSLLHFSRWQQLTGSLAEKSWLIDGAQSKYQRKYLNIELDVCPEGNETCISLLPLVAWPLCAKIWWIEMRLREILWHYIMNYSYSYHLIFIVPHPNATNSYYIERPSLFTEAPSRAESFHNGQR